MYYVTTFIILHVLSLIMHFDPIFFHFSFPPFCGGRQEQRTPVSRTHVFTASHALCHRWRMVSVTVLYRPRPSRPLSPTDTSRLCDLRSS